MLEKNTKIMGHSRFNSHEEEVRAFAAGSALEYSFPSELSAKERKVVKEEAERLGLSTKSFGMGLDRRIHIFRPSTPPSPSLSPSQPELSTISAQNSAKNTFIDEPIDSQRLAAAPDPAADMSSVPQSCTSQVETESTQVETESTTDSLDSSRIGCSDPGSGSNKSYSIKNSFVHFPDETSHADPRIIKSMPEGKFEEALLIELEMKRDQGLVRPSPLSLELDDSDKTYQGMVFPSTPDAEMSCRSFHQLDAAIAEAEQLPPAVWGLDPSPPVLPLPSALWMSPMPPAPPSITPLLPQIPELLAPGTVVQLCGLSNQPAFNGARGTISSFDREMSRYNISLDVASGAQKGRMVKVKAENVIVSMPLSAPGACNANKAMLMLDRLIIGGA